MTYQNHIFYVRVLYIRLSTIWHTRITSFMYVYCISDCQPYDIPESHLLCDVYCISDCQPYDIPESHLLCTCIGNVTCIVYQTVNHMTYQNHIFYVRVLYIRLSTSWHTRITSFMYMYCISDCQPYDIPESHLLCMCIVYQTVNHMTYQNHIFYVRVLYTRLSTIWHTRITSFMYMYCISDCQPYEIPASHLLCMCIVYQTVNHMTYQNHIFYVCVLYIRLSTIWHTRITSFMYVYCISDCQPVDIPESHLLCTCIVYQTVNHMTYQNHIFYVRVLEMWRVLYIRLSIIWHTRITSFMYVYCISDCQPYDIPESHLSCTCIVYVTCIVYQTVNHMTYQNHIFLCDVCCILDCQPVDIPESHILCDVYCISDCQPYDIPESHLLCDVYCISDCQPHDIPESHLFMWHVLYIRLSTIWHTRITSFMYVYCISDCQPVWHTRITSFMYMYCISDCQPYDIPESHLLCTCIVYVTCIVYQTVNHMSYQNHIFLCTCVVYQTVNQLTYQNHIFYVTCIVYQTVNHMTYQNHIFYVFYVTCIIYQTVNHMTYQNHIFYVRVLYIRLSTTLTYQNHIFYVTCIVYQTVNHMTYQNHIFYVRVLYIRLSTIWHTRNTSFMWRVLYIRLLTIWHTRITSFMYVYCISDCQPYDIPESHLLCTCIVYQTVNHMTYQNHIFYVYQTVLYIRLSTIWHTRITSFMYVYCISDCQPYDIPESHLLCTCIVYQTVNQLTYQNHIFYVHVLYIRLSTIWHTRITSFMYVYCVTCIVYQTVNHMTYQNHIFYVRVLYIRLSTIWHTRITSFMYVYCCDVYCISDCQPYVIPESHLFMWRVLYIRLSTSWHTRITSLCDVYCISDCQPYDIPESHLLCTCIVYQTVNHMTYQNHIFYVTCIVYQTVNHMTYQNHIFYVRVLYIRLSTIWHTRITSFMWRVLYIRLSTIWHTRITSFMSRVLYIRLSTIWHTRITSFMYVYCISDCQPYDIPESHLLCKCIVYQTNQTYQNHIFYVIGNVLYIRLSTIWHTRITSFMYVYCISDCQPYDIPESHLLCTCIVYQTVNHMTYQNHIFYVRVLYIRLSTIWHTRITSFYVTCMVY